MSTDQKIALTKIANEGVSCLTEGQRVPPEKPLSEGVSEKVIDLIAKRTHLK